MSPSRGLALLRPALLAQEAMMRQSIPFVLSVMLSTLCQAQEAPPKGLEAYAGKDLRKLENKEVRELYRQFRALTGDKADEKIEQFHGNRSRACQDN